VTSQERRAGHFARDLPPYLNMPGIVGLITQMPRERAEQELRQMVEALLHEPFYASGMWADESLGVYVGWVARQGSFSDGMPLRNERGDVVLVFSGEEFSEPHMAERVKEPGRQPATSTVGYLTYLYEGDPTFPANLNGWFHGLLVDRERGIAALFNDRYGMHRIYFHESEEAFYFAAEAKAILAVRPELRRLDPRSLGEFIACGCALEGRSLFEGIGLLPGGAKWVFQNRSLAKKGTYFKPQEWENQEPLEPEPFYRQLRGDFSRALPRYFSGPEQVAMSITGGLDTRLVMAWQKSESGSLACYTFGGPLRESQDVILGRKIARHCGQPHQVIPLGEEFLARFPHYAERVVYLTDGGADVSLAPDLYFHERAREIAPVRMTGLYGGEVLRRTRTFKPEMPPPGLFQPDFVADVRQARETYEAIHKGHPVSFAVFKQAPWSQYGILQLEQTQCSVRTPFLDNEVVRTVFRAPEPALLNDQVSFRLVGDGNPALLRFPTDRGVSANGGRLAGAISRAYLEFLFKAEYAYDMGMPQWLARLDHAFAPLRLERCFLGRHKVSHFRIWYRNALAGYLREMLLDSKTFSRPYINRNGLVQAVEGHLKGDRNYTEPIHKVLTLELIHRLFLAAP
jgi:asparagine synthase (glutamine-hydrolysing)